MSAGSKGPKGSKVKVDHLIDSLALAFSKFSGFQEEKEELLALACSNCCSYHCKCCCPGRPVHNRVSRPESETRWAPDPSWRHGFG